MRRLHGAVRAHDLEILRRGYLAAHHHAASAGEIDGDIETFGKSRRDEGGAHTGRDEVFAQGGSP